MYFVRFHWDILCNCMYFNLENLANVWRSTQVFKKKSRSRTQWCQRAVIGWLIEFTDQLNAIKLKVKLKISEAAHRWRFVKSEQENIEIKEEKLAEML